VTKNTVAKNLLGKRASRRDVMTMGAALAGGGAIGGLNATQVQAEADYLTRSAEGSTRNMGTVGDVGTEINGFDVTEMLTDWDTGTLSREDGQVVRTFTLDAIDKDIEIAPGVIFPAWTYNGRVPGPTLRATEGELLRVVFRNFGSHPHSIHFHGIHSALMDGVTPASGLIDPGDEFTYEFPAKPFGCHLYHCHALPLTRHMHKGMYGAFIIDPDPDKHPEYSDVAKSRLLGSAENLEWQEFIMVMNAFDTNFDGANEFYAVNTVANHYKNNPIRVEKSRPVRIYLVNVTEFDPINSLHMHANFYNYFDHGTTLTPTLQTVDTIMQCQGQRGILEMTFADHDPGQYMFHAHQAEFTELGWMAFFDVVEDAT